MKAFVFAVVAVLALAAVCFGQTDSLTDTGKVMIYTVPKPVDTIFGFTTFRKTVRVKRTGANMCRIRINGAALDTTVIREWKAGKYKINGGNDTMIVDSFDIAIKTEFINMWSRIKK